tara:strand:+ start:4341 stop:4604 length:264 start_codon:yes stop_codon:yes gene_type:complete
MVIKLKGAQVNAGTSTGNGSNLNLATLVLVQNITANTHLVTLEDADAVLIGSFNIPPNQNIRLVKSPLDEIFAANVGVKLTPIGFSA